VAADQMIPAQSFVDVPVKVLWKDLRDDAPGWVIEPKPVKRGVVTAVVYFRGMIPMHVYDC